MKQLLTYILICVLTIFVGCRQQSACDTILFGSSLGADIAISSGHPLLADLTINHDNTYMNGEHEIVVVGYTAETHQYIYIDPATGTYKLTIFFDLNKNEQ